MAELFSTAPAARTASRFSGFRGFVLLVAVCLPLLLWRMTLESSLWCDEIFSISLSQFPWRKIIDVTGADTHPPGQFFIVKLWIELGKHLGFEPGIFWARFLNVLPWLALAFAAWRLGRRLLGAGRGMLLAWCIMLSAQVNYVAKDVRAYSFAVPAFGIAMLCLLVLDDERRRRTLSARQTWGLWILYTLAIEIALWMHLLGAFMAFWFGLGWLVLAARGPGRRNFLIAGTVAHAIALIAFSPWMFFITHNLGNWTSRPHTFMTPPTWENLAKVFVLWFPLGQLSGGAIRLQQPKYLIPLGLLTLLLPLLFLRFGFRRSKARADIRPTTTLTLLTTLIPLAVGTFYVLTLWLLDRFGIVQVFHGPRYTVMAIVPYIIGMVMLACRVTDYARWPAWSAALLLVPWMLCGATGQIIDATLEPKAGLAPTLRKMHPPIPPPAAPVYVMPPELLPYYSRTLRGRNILPIEDIAKITTDTATTTITILSLDRWAPTRREREVLIEGVITGGGLCDAFNKINYPGMSNAGTTLWQLTGFRPEAARRMAAGGWKTTLGFPPSGTLAQLHPRDFQLVDGWNVLEAAQSGTAQRWTSADTAAVRLSTPLHAGDYIVGLGCIRLRYPDEETSLSISFKDDPASATLRLKPGSTNNLEFPITLARSHQTPVLLIHHPSVLIADIDPEIKDPRRLGLLVYELWIKPAKK